MADKIYIYCASCHTYDSMKEFHYMEARASDGEVIAGHISSDHDFGKSDMGIGTIRKHDLYIKKYPKGYKLVWIEKDANK